ncbi:hypothetical protein GCM10027440_37830 [Nocardiopsis coralliicola]
MRHATRQLRIRLPRSLGGIDPTRVPPRIRRFDLALPVRPGAPRTGPGVLHITAPGDLAIPARLHRRGLADYRPHALSFYLAALELVRPGAVLDVGANVGVFAALAAARSRRRVFAFEPSPQAARTARTIAAENGLGVEVVDLALSNHSGTGQLHLSATSDATNSLNPGFRPRVGRLPVEVRPLAHWREEANVAPAVIKIDTESTEPDVISGSLEVLRRFRPWVLCDVLPGRSTGDRLTALLEPLDYYWYELSGTACAPRTSITGGPGRTGSMWLFAPSPVPEHMWRRAAEWRAALGHIG